MGNSADDRLTEKHRGHGYESDPCVKCGNFTMMHNGSQLKCDTCGSDQSPSPSTVYNAQGSSLPEETREFPVLRGEDAIGRH